MAEHSDLDFTPEFPALDRNLLMPLDLGRLEPMARMTHKPRILLLYGSLRQRSYSRLMIEEAARLLAIMGAETRIFDPRDLPVANSVPADHPKVQELRELSIWSEAHGGDPQPVQRRQGL